jgi:adenylate kinase
MQEKFAQKTVFSFFGPPGSGKGTLSQQCVAELGFEMLSTGNLCRKHIFLGTEFGKLIDDYIKAGQLVPDDLITNIVGDWLSNKSSLGVPIILDGYPRTSGQAEYFLKKFKNFVPDYNFKIFCFIISDKEIIKRLTNRIICENQNCQAVYFPLASAFKTEICEKCGTKLIKREDDKLEVITDRLKRYPKYKKCLLNFYESVGQPVEAFNVENKTIEQVFNDFKEFL